jgi:hypothetical protein
MAVYTSFLGANVSIHVSRDFITNEFLGLQPFCRQGSDGLR